jgi:hypothetical protein
MTRRQTHTLLALAAVVLLTILTTYSLRTSFSPSSSQLPEFIQVPSEPSSSSAEVPVIKLPNEPATPPSSPPHAANAPEPAKHGIPDHPTYKAEHKPPPLVIDNFPLVASAQSAADLPSIPPWNKPPTPHVPENTPLFIGFTRNWRLLQQTVVSYITAGWPPEDIFVVENTGTMKSNERGMLSLQNPFFLNHTRLNLFGVNIVTTPTLLSFSQLQNFFIWLAIEKGYSTYFYGHMDVIALAFEDQFKPSYFGNAEQNNYAGFKSIYVQAVEALRRATSPEPDPNASNSSKPWAARFFSYDRLALVNREAYESIGGWDTAIPYYFSDCDMHERLKMYGFEYNEPYIEIGSFLDISLSLDDLIVLYRKKSPVKVSFTIPASEQEELNREQEEERKFEEQKKAEEEKKKVEEREKPRQIEKISPSTWISDELGSPAFKQLLGVVEKMERHKVRIGRNTWQGRQTGGKGEPYYRDPEGFEKAIQMTTQMGEDVYVRKWGLRTCDLLPFGRKAGDEWRMGHD